MIHIPHLFLKAGSALIAASAVTVAAAVSSSNPAVVVAVVAAVVGPVGAYLAITRRLSGKIGTSDADALWGEARAIREDYATRLSTAELRTRDVEKRMAEVERHNNELLKENIALSNKTAGYETIIEGLRAQIATFETVIADQMAQIGGLLDRLKTDPYRA